MSSHHPRTERRRARTDPGQHGDGGCEVTERGQAFSRRKFKTWPPTPLAQRRQDEPIGSFMPPMTPMTPMKPLTPLRTGTLVRYGSAPTALMRIDSISFNHGGPGQHRYYGEQCDGGSHAAYHAHCRNVTEADLDTWNAARFAPLARSA